MGSDPAADGETAWVTQFPLEERGFFRASHGNGDLALNRVSQERL